ncbi:MAG: class I SAM-dependent methyltransferase [Verrucomicrobiales bacterium]|nr:class I SAM-dependent methyltransferase [Verrucomicrobiales bacterium]
MPSPASTAGVDPASHRYRGASGLAYHDGKRALVPQAEEWVRTLRAEKFQQWVRSSDVVFEFGVGGGWNLARLNCARRIGCDAADFLAERLRPLGIEFCTQSSAIPDASADVVLCHQTLEHLLEPAAALREFARIAKPGGRMLLHVPWEVERRYARFDPNDPNHHLYHWNAQNLGNLVAVLGWSIEQVQVRQYGYDRFAANFAARWRLGENGFRALRAVLIALRPLREVELIARR